MNLYVSVFRDSKVLSITRYGKEGPGPEETVMNINSQLGLSLTTEKGNFFAY